MGNLRGEIYYWSLELMEEGKELQSIILLLATWNFANFRYHMKDFDLDKFKKILKDCNFDFFKEKKITEVNLESEEIKKRVMEIYRKLSNIDGIKYVGATKVMHLECPEFFVMWDKRIIDHYNVSYPPSGEDYLEFLKKMKEKYKRGDFKNLRKDVTIPRAIDLYNMYNFSNT